MVYLIDRALVALASLAAIVRQALQSLTTAVSPRRDIEAPPEPRALESAAASEAEGAVCGGLLPQGPAGGRAAAVQPAAAVAPPSEAPAEVPPEPQAPGPAATPEAEGVERGGLLPGEAATGAPTPQSATPTPLPSEAAGGSDSYGFCLNQGPRASMEDAVDVMAGIEGEAASFYAVYDGHGGAEAVQYIRRRLPEAIKERGGFANSEHCDEALQEAFLATDTELLQHFQSQQGSAAHSNRSRGAHALSSGCVASVALVHGAHITLANLGDCRALLCSGGEITHCTEDHRAPDNMAERERLQQAGIEVSSDGYLHGTIGVSRTFGDWAWEGQEKCRGLLSVPEVTHAQVDERTEFLVIACDGVFEVITSKEVVQIVRRRLRNGDSAREAAEVLIKNAIKRKSSDNVSAIVVLFNPPPADLKRAAPRLFGTRPLLAAALDTAGAEGELRKEGSTE